MSKFMQAALGGVVAGGNKYNEIKDQQTKFQRDQTTAAAADMRKRAFAKYDYELRDIYTDSGMEVTETGQQLNKKEAALAEPDTMRTQKSAKDEESLAKITAAEDRQEARRKAAVLDTREYQEGKAEEAATIKQSNLKIKDEKDLKKQFRAEVGKAIDIDSTPLDKHNAVGQAIALFSNDERLQNETTYKTYQEVEGIAADMLAGKKRGMSRKAVETKLKESGKSKTEIATALQVLEQAGAIKEGIIPFTGYEGSGW